MITTDKKMTWRDVSTSFNGKMLRTVLKIDDDNDAVVQIYYSPEHKRVTNSFGVSYNEQTGKHVARLNVTKMRNEGSFHVGGIGKTVTVSEPVTRQAIKTLWAVAEKLDAQTLVGLATGQSTEASLIV